MKRIFILALFSFLVAGSFAFADEGIGTATMEKYRQLKTSLEQAYQSKEGIYAKDILDSANRTLTRAAEGIEAKKEKATLDALDTMSLQIALAKIKTEERVAAEKTAVTRNKADKLSQRLDDILSGKGDAK